MKHHQNVMLQLSLLTTVVVKLVSAIIPFPFMLPLIVYSPFFILRNLLFLQRLKSLESDCLQCIKELLWRSVWDGHLSLHVLLYKCKCTSSYYVYSCNVALLSCRRSRKRSLPFMSNQNGMMFVCYVFFEPGFPDNSLPQQRVTGNFQVIYCR